MMGLYRGTELAARLNAETAAIVAGLERAPRCVVLLNGDDAGMAAYGRRLVQSAVASGIALQTEAYPVGVSATLARLGELAADDRVDAVATLYPLPHGLDPLQAAIVLGAGKDIDGLHPMNAGLLALTDTASARAPATAMACLLIAEDLLGPLRGVETVLIGASRIVGRPLAQMLLNAGATVTVTHAETRDLAAHTVRADLVITAAGQPGLITAAHLRNGAVVLDVSINEGPEGLLGDVESGLDMTTLLQRKITLTHVPDGVGPVTTACLLSNIAAIAREAGI